MSSLRDRQRAAARARLEREMAARQAAARRRRQRASYVGAGAGLLVVLLGVVWIVMATTGGKPKHNAAASASATPGPCDWKANNPSPEPSASPNTALKDVGTPPATGEPRSGTRDMTMVTNLGTIVVRMDLAKAPCTSASFTYLASKKFFDNTSCDRLVNEAADPNQQGSSDLHVLQCGDPSGTGSGGPTYQFGDENLPTNQRPTYPKGVVAMANAGANTNGSQFFMVFADSTIPANYTIFGTIVQGMDILEKVAAGGDDQAFASSAGGGHPKTKLTFTSVTVGPAESGQASAGSSASGSASGSPSPTAAASPTHS